MKSSFLGDSRAIHDLRRAAGRLGNAPFPIVIEGETGTGKFEFALLLHERSSRGYEPFIDVHCANLSETIFESTLFGHERGAFTDARERRIGRVEAAANGTLLFDEVDCLSELQQAKLLRFIDRRTYERVGGRETLTSGAGLVFSTNRDLAQLTESQQFRRDLFYRIGWVILRIPPLRERPEDVVLLATLLLEEARSNLGLPRIRWASAAIDLLCSHPWPGNVRELKALVQVITYLHAQGETIEASDVRAYLGSAIGPNAVDGERGLTRLRTEAERRVIADALRATDGNRAQAARLLKIGRRTLQGKIAKYRL